MNKWVSASLALVAVVGFVVVLTSGNATGESPKPAGEYKPVIPMDDLMETVDEAFETVGKESKAKKYSKARAAAFLVAEMCNVLQYHHSEEVQGEEQMKKWKEIAISIRDDMVAVAEAAKKKDDDTIKKTLSKVEETCENCHDMRD